jgi:hypothetical protein
MSGHGDYVIARSALGYPIQNGLNVVSLEIDSERGRTVAGYEGESVMATPNTPMDRAINELQAEVIRYSELEGTLHRRLAPVLVENGNKTDTRAMSDTPEPVQAPLVEIIRDLTGRLASNNYGLSGTIDNLQV